VDTFGLVYYTSLLAISIIAAFNLLRDGRITIAWVPFAAIIGTYIVTTGQVPFTDIKIDWPNALSGAQYVIDTSLQSLKDAHKAFEGSADMYAGADLGMSLARYTLRGVELAGRFILRGAGSGLIGTILAITGVADYLISLLYEAYSYGISLLGMAALVLYFLKYLLSPEMASAFIAIGGLVIAGRPDRLNNVVVGLTIMYIPVVLSFAVAVLPPLQLMPQSSANPFFQNLVYYNHADPLVMIMRNENATRLVAIYQDVVTVPIANKTGETYYVKGWVWAGLDIYEHIRWRLDWVRGKYYNGSLPPPQDFFTSFTSVPVFIPPARVNYTDDTPIGSYASNITQKSVEYFDCVPGQCSGKYLAVKFYDWTFAYIPHYEYSRFNWRVSSDVDHDSKGKVAWLNGEVYYYCYGYADECSASVWLNPIASPKTSLSIESLEKSDYVGGVSLELREVVWLGLHSDDFEKIMKDLKSRNFTLPIPPDPNLTQVVEPIREHLRTVQNYTWIEPNQYRLHLSVETIPKIQCDEVGNSTICYEVPVDRWVKIKWKSTVVNHTPTPPPFFWITPPPYEEFNHSLTLLMLSSLIYGDEKLGKVFYLTYGHLFGGGGSGSGQISFFNFDITSVIPIDISFGMPQLSLWPYYSPDKPGYCNIDFQRASLLGAVIAGLLFLVQPVCDVSMKVLTFYNSLTANLLTAASLLGVIGVVLGSKGRAHLKPVEKVAERAQDVVQTSMAVKLVPNPPLGVAAKYSSRMQQRAAALLRGAITTGERAKYAAAYLIATLTHGALTFLQYASSASVFSALSRILLVATESITLPSKKLTQKIGYPDRWSKIEYAADMITSVAEVRYMHFIEAMLKSVARRVADALSGMKAAYGWPGIFFILRHPLSYRANHAKVVGGIMRIPLATPPSLPFINYAQLAHYLGPKILQYSKKMEKMGMQPADPAHIAAAMYIARVHGIKDPLKLLQGDSGQLIAEIVKRGWGPAHGAVAAWAMGVAKGVDASSALRAALRWNEVAVATMRYDPKTLMDFATVSAEAAKRGAVPEAELGVLAALAIRGVGFSRDLAALGATHGLGMAAKAPDLFVKIYGQAITTRTPINVLGLASNVAVIEAIRHNPVAVYALHPREEVALLAALQIRGGSDPFGNKVDWVRDAISRYYSHDIRDIRDMLATLKPAGGNAEALLHIINAAEKGIAPTMAPDNSPLASALVSKAAKELINAEPSIARLWAKAALSKEGYSVEEIKALISSPPPVLAGEAAKEAARLSLRYEIEAKLKAGASYDQVLTEMSNSAASVLNDVLNLPVAPLPPYVHAPQPPTVQPAQPQVPTSALQQGMQIQAGGIQQGVTSPHLPPPQAGQSTQQPPAQFQPPQPPTAQPVPPHQPQPPSPQMPTSSTDQPQAQPTQSATQPQPTPQTPPPPLQQGSVPQTSPPPTQPQADQSIMQNQVKEIHQSPVQPSQPPLTPPQPPQMDRPSQPPAIQPTVKLPPTDQLQQPLQPPPKSPQPPPTQPAPPHQPQSPLPQIPPSSTDQPQSPPTPSDVQPQQQEGQTQHPASQPPIQQDSMLPPSSPQPQTDQAPAIQSMQTQADHVQQQATPDQIGKLHQSSMQPTQPPSVQLQPHTQTDQLQQHPSPPPQPRQISGPRDLTDFVQQPVNYVEDNMLKILEDIHKVAEVPAKTANEERGRELLLAYYHLLQDDLQNAVRYAQPWIEVVSPQVIHDFIKLLKAEGLEVRELAPASLVTYAYDVLRKEAKVKSVEEALRVDVSDNRKLKQAQEVLRDFVSKVQNHAEAYYKSKKPDGSFHRLT